MAGQNRQPVVGRSICPGGIFYAVGLKGPRLVFLPTYTHFQGEQPSYFKAYLSRAGYVDEVTDYRPFRDNPARPLDEPDRRSLRRYLLQGMHDFKASEGIPFKIA